MNLTNNQNYMNEHNNAKQEQEPEKEINFITTKDFSLKILIKIEFYSIIGVIYNYLNIMGY